MSEGDAVLAATAPATRASLAAELAALGVPRGGVLIAHLSLSALGWTAGGALALLDALGDALGPEGTLVLPAFSSDLSEPSRWQAPPVPEAWWETIRAELPAFDPARTPTRGLGRAPELFRTLPGVQRSTHPTSSFAARGPLAAARELSKSVVVCGALCFRSVSCARHDPWGGLAAVPSLSRRQMSGCTNPRIAAVLTTFSGN